MSGRRQCPACSGHGVVEVRDHEIPADWICCRACDTFKAPQHFAGNHRRCNRCRTIARAKSHHRQPGPSRLPPMISGRTFREHFRAEPRHVDRDANPCVCCRLHTAVGACSACPCQSYFERGL